jgi:hypothetical protein
MLRPEPHQDDFTVRIYIRKRCGAHLCQRLHCIAMHFCDTRHGVTRGKHSAESRSEKKVATLYVSISRQVGER